MLRKGKPTDAQGEHAYLCPALGASWSHLKEMAEGLARLGVDIVQIDQMPGGGTPPCFSAAHPHPPAGGTTVYDSVSAHLTDLRARVRRVNPRAALSLECPGELYIPAVDVFHCREYMHGYWPREKPGDRGVPLFSYLYHEYALGYGGDSAPFVVSDANADLAVCAQALNLHAGRLPGAAVWMKSVDFSQVSAIQRRFMQDVSRLIQSPAGQYLLKGKVLSGPQEEDYIVIRGEASAGKELTMRVPRVLCNRFALNDGSVGTLYINLSREPASVAPDNWSRRRQEVVWPPGTEFRERRLSLDPHGIAFTVSQRQ
jgi:hypothetical protein